MPVTSLIKSAGANEAFRTPKSFRTRLFTSSRVAPATTHAANFLVSPLPQNDDCVARLLQRVSVPLAERRGVRERGIDLEHLVGDAKILKSRSNFPIHVPWSFAKWPPHNKALQLPGPAQDEPRRSPDRASRVAAHPVNREEGSMSWEEGLPQSTRALSDHAALVVDLEPRSARHYG